MKSSGVPIERDIERLHMTLEIGLAAAFAGFLVLFWFTPVGVPALKAFGGGEMSPDLRFGYRPAEAYGLIERYGPRGVGHWRRMLWLDMIFPGVYGALFALLMLRWAAWVHAAPAWRTAGAALPLAAGASDYVENVLLLGILAAWPKRAPAAVRAASLFTCAKFIFSWSTLALPLVFWALTLTGRGR
jgi:hypothetical protein